MDIRPHTFVISTGYAGVEVETLLPSRIEKENMSEIAHIQPKLEDSFQRRFVYLRLSVTDRCNFRCVYCLPHGQSPSNHLPAELSVHEVQRLVKGFVSLGVGKVRLTGGEPTTRKDIVEIAHAVSAVAGINKLAITTNGYRLKDLALPLMDAGVTALNISIDSLDQDNFKRITGHNKLHSILDSVDYALNLGMAKIKVNAVLMREHNYRELEQFLNWIKHRPISVRFIELMRTGNNAEFFSAQNVSGREVKAYLQKSGWNLKQRSFDDGPAEVFTHPDYQGSIGVIAPYSKDFCHTCNRLRVSSRGDLRLCLFGEGDASLREFLQSDNQQNELVARIQQLVGEKPRQHYLEEEKYGNTWNLAGIGG